MVELDSPQALLANNRPAGPSLFKEMLEHDADDGAEEVGNAVITCAVESEGAVIEGKEETKQV